MTKEELQGSQLKQLAWLEKQARDRTEKAKRTEAGEFRDMGRFLMEVLREQRHVFRDFSEDAGYDGGGAAGDGAKVAAAFGLDE